MNTSKNFFGELDSSIKMKDTFDSNKSLTMNWTMSDHNLLKELELSEIDYAHVVFASILIIIGAIGNANAFVVYYKYFDNKNIKRTFVLWLAVVDFFNCALIIPFSIHISIFKYTITSDVLCKTFYFLGSFLAGFSLVLLDIVAVERFTKIVLPFRGEFSRKLINKICSISCIVCLVLCIPHLTIKHADLNSIPGDRDLVGSWCTNRRDSKFWLTFARVNNIFMLLFLILCCLVCAVLYSIIGCKLANTPDNFEMPQATANRRKMTIENAKSATKIFLVASLISCIGYVPNLIVSTYLNFFQSYAMVHGLGPFHPFRRLIISTSFINSVVNPIVYTIMDRRFRQQCKVHFLNILEYLYCTVR